MTTRKLLTAAIAFCTALAIGADAFAGHRARLLNEAAVRHIMEVWPTLRSGLEASVPGVENVGNRVVMTTSPPWTHFQTVAMGSAPSPYELGQAFKEHVKRNLWPQGVTQFESRLDKASEVSAMYLLLREEGKLPVRFGWHYEQHRQPIFGDEHVRAFYTDRGFTWTTMEGGNPWLWLGGVGSEGDGDTVNGPCMQGFAELSDPRMENCSDVNSATTHALLVGALEAGWRFVGMHAIGPGQVALAAEYVEKAMSNNRDLTLERVRSMRHTFAHGTLLGNDPRMHEIAKKYNFTLVVDPHRAFNDEPGFVDRYLGGDYSWIAPIKTALDAGVNVAVEFGGFEGLQAIVTRVHEPTGEVYGAHEAVDRVVALKLVTIWSAFSMFSDSMTGNLVPGKYADFIVLDKDYMQGPDDEIKNNKVIMTFIDGELVWQESDGGSAAAH
ncbi:MAG: amidohydrolase family protein [Woeseiaceae bacterium]|nr:amidohydrolase family protein [Woeseiaceae bacterium]